jgi:hypothetical protein
VSSARSHPLEQFKKRKGHCDVPQSHIEDGANLGRWLGEQRHQKKKGGLPADRQQRLEDIGVVWDPLEARREHMLGLLEQFKKRKGHCDVPRSHIEHGANLGTWLNTQRRQKKKGGLPADIQQRLEEIGVVLWDPLEAQREHMVGLLKQFKKQKGHCNVPELHIEDGANLGTWLRMQRRQKKKGGLPADRQQHILKKLASYGIVRPHEAQWEHRFGLLEQFKKREGHCNVPLLHIEDGSNLGHWLSKQRHQKKKGSLLSDRERRLEALGVVWRIGNGNQPLAVANSAVESKFKIEGTFYFARLKQIGDNTSIPLSVRLGCWHFIPRTAEIL